MSNMIRCMVSLYHSKSITLCLQQINKQIRKKNVTYEDQKEEKRIFVNFILMYNASS